MYIVSILGTTNDKICIDRELGRFQTLDEAKKLCEQLNELLRDKLLCIYRDLLEWRFNISIEEGDGTETTLYIMDSDKDELTDI